MSRYYNSGSGCAAGISVGIPDRRNIAAGAWLVAAVRQEQGMRDYHFSVRSSGNRAHPGANRKSAGMVDSAGRRMGHYLYV